MDVQDKGEVTMSLGPPSACSHRSRVENLPGLCCGPGRHVIAIGRSPRCSMYVT